MKLSTIRRACFSIFLAISLTLPVATMAHAAVLQARHDLHVQLEPENARLRGTDRISLILEQACSLDLHLADGAEVLRLELDGAPLKYERQHGWLWVDMPAAHCDGEKELLLEYTVTFNDPLPQNPANMDNPGFGVNGVINEQGAFLMAGSGWHPQIAGKAESFHVTVQAPLGIYAVTLGALERLEDGEGISTSVWNVEHVLEALPLCAGAYVVEQAAAPLLAEATQERGRSEVPIQTFFSRDNAQLSQRYLDAVARHMAYYSKLHGAYAFEKFAVVENFFPTGFGFPSFTLLGGQVLRLPFIPETSLRHEVAHCWWGNGVLVNYAEGNWCEGLTSYVSDYMAKEEQSPVEARDYRLRTLRNYALLVGEGGNMPLSDFVSRNSPATQAIGYGKAMFVFHMLRREVGDDAFWEALRRLYAEKLFRKASWADILDVFVSQGSLDQKEARIFLDQWVKRAAPPRLLIERTELRRSEEGWRISGTLKQRLTPDGNLFQLHVPVVAQCGEGHVEKLLELQGEQAPFELYCGERPLALVADPGADVFRLLSPVEIPPTVNSLKGAESMSVIIAGKGTEMRQQLARFLAMALNQPDAAILTESSMDQGQIAQLAQDEKRALLFIGAPESEAVRALAPPLPHGGELTPDGVRLPVLEKVEGADAVMLLTKNYSTSRSAGLFLPLQTENAAGDAALAAAVRKITHYGSYGLLAFAEGRNLLKLRWPAQSSPMRVDLREGDSAADPFDDDFFQPHFGRSGRGVD